MSLYNQQEVNETTTYILYDRASFVAVDNPLDGHPKIRYIEERVRREEGKPDVSIGRVGSVEKVLTPENVAEQFDLRHPATGQPLGAKATFGEVQLLLYSLYFHLATERDNNETP